MRRTSLIVILSAAAAAPAQDMGPSADIVLREAGLPDVSRVGHYDNVDVPFMPAGKRVSRDVGAGFRTENATFFFRIGGRYPAETWAETDNGAVIVARRVGRGWVVLLGMAFCKRSDQINRILANAVMVR